MFCWNLFNLFYLQRLMLTLEDDVDFLKRKIYICVLREKRCLAKFSCYSTPL